MKICSLFLTNNKIFYLFISIFISSCCTKKDCDDVDTLRIAVVLDKGNSSDYELFIYEQPGNLLIDSAGGNNRQLFLDLFADGNLRGKKYVIFQENRSRKDSISEISWKVEEKQVNCNKCMIIFNQKEKVKQIADLKYKLNGVVLKNEQKITL